MPSTLKGGHPVAKINDLLFCLNFLIHSIYIVELELIPQLL